MQSTEGGRPVPPFPSSPFLIGYVVVDTTKGSQESARRRGRKGELRNSLVFPFFIPSFRGILLLTVWHTVNPLLGPMEGLISGGGGLI